MKHFVPVTILLALTACGEKEQTVVFPEPAGSTKQAASPDSGEPSAPDAAQVSGSSGSSGASASQAEFGKTGSAGSSGSSGASDASDGGMYTVKQGDSLAGIARQHNVNYQDLARWNNIKDPNLIYPSQQLRLSKP